MKKEEKRVLRQHIIKKLLRENEDIYRLEEVVQVPFIEKEEGYEAICSWFAYGISSNKIRGSPMHVIERLYDCVGVSIEEYWQKNKNKKVKTMTTTREEAIKSMYHYKSTEEEHLAIPETFEIIYNWYIDGFDSIEKLEAMFDVEDLYDMDLELKIYPKDQYDVA